MATDQPSEAKPLDAEPKNGQRVTHNGTSYTTIKEGIAHILVPAAATASHDTKKHAKKDTDPSARQSVFYNPIQQFNRDLSVLAIKAFSDDFLAFRNLRSQTARARRQEKKNSKKSRTNAPESKAEAEEPLQHQEAAEQQSTKRKAEDAFSQEHADEPANKAPKTETNPEPTAPKSATETPDQPVTAPTNCASHSQPQPEVSFRILDALSATGLRALRYAHEIPAVTEVVANDLSRGAVESIQLNVKHNRLEHKIQANQGNALGHMYSLAATTDWDNDTKYHVVDLDPYGTAAPFLDASLHALRNGGLLCVTCTDAGVFASCGYPEKTYALYGGTPIKGAHCHEGGLRIILHAIASAGAKMGLAIEPMMSLSIDFYVRLWVRVRRSAAEVKYLAGKTMLVYNCDSGCGSWTTQLLARNDTFETKDGSIATKHMLAQGPSCSANCRHCGFRTHISGPMWAGPLHNPAFLKKILSILPSLDRETYATADRIEGMVSTALEELDSPDSLLDDGKDAASRPIPPLKPFVVDSSPFFFMPSALAGVVHCQAPPEAPIKGALRRAGYKAARSHSRAGSVKTNAPWDFVWRMMREWVRQKAPPIKEGSLKPKSPGYTIMHGAQQGEQKDGNGEQEDGNWEQKGEKGEREEGKSGPDAPGAEPTTDTAEPTTDSAAPPKDNAAATLPEIIFDAQLGKDSTKRRLLRYQENPRANWGPMNRASQ